MAETIPYGASPVYPVGYQSNDNSTHTALAAGATWTGRWETSPAEHVGYNVKADQGGTLYLDFSIDGGLTTAFSRAIPVYADTGRFSALVKGSRSFRARYVNGSSPQTKFDLVTFYGNNLFPYSSTAEGELRITQAEQEDNKFVAYGNTNVTATGYACLIDLSDTVNYPHEYSGRIDLSTMYLQVDRDSTAQGAVRVGLITRINGTSADITYVQGITFDKSDDRHINRDRNFSPSQLKCATLDGATPYIASQFRDVGNTAINTGITLPDFRGAGQVAPAVGDLIIYYLRTAGSFGFSVSAFYHGMEQNV